MNEVGKIISRETNPTQNRIERTRMQNWTEAEVTELPKCDFCGATACIPIFPFGLVRVVIHPSGISI